MSKYKMVLIETVSTFNGNRPSMMEVIEKKKKLLEIFKKAMMPVEEPEPTTVEVKITTVLTEKEEVEMDAVLKKVFDSK